MNLEIFILKFLRAAGADLLTSEDQLRTDLRMFRTPPPTGSEISEALNSLETRQQAVAVRDRLTGQIKWRITDEGRAELAARRI